MAVAFTSCSTSKMVELAHFDDDNARTEAKSKSGIACARVKGADGREMYEIKTRHVSEATALIPAEEADADPSK